MSDPAMDVARYLNSLTHSWFPELKMVADVGPAGGNNLFVHDMPDVPDFAVAILRYSGRPPTETFSKPLLVRHPRIQVNVRDQRSNIALDRAGDILSELVKVKDTELNGVKYQRIKAVGEAEEIGPDSKNRQRAVVNFEVSYYGD